MSNPKGLSDWVKSKIDKTGNAEFTSNRQFALAYGVDPKTVKRLIDNKPVELATLEKLMRGAHMKDIEQFTVFLSQFARDPVAQTETVEKIKGSADRLSPDKQRAVWALMESLLQENDAQ